MSTRKGAIRRSQRYEKEFGPVIIPREFIIHYCYPLSARERRRTTRTFGTAMMKPGSRYVIMPHGRVKRLYAGPMHE